jgi:uncharacterized protein (DUF2236 family)
VARVDDACVGGGGRSAVLPHTLAVVVPVRDVIGKAIRSRVSGTRGANVVRDIVAADGERWFGPDRPIWTVHTDAAMFVGGLRALLLQSLHPLAMAGVADHSDFRDDPWGRLQRTAEFLTWTTFGTSDQVERAIAQVRAVHDRVAGITPEGVPYSANDPHLLKWVHVAELDSFLAAHQRYGTPRLDAAERDGYVADMARVGAAVGVLDPPRTEAELRATLASYRPELRGTKAAREAARFLMLPSQLPVVAYGPYAVLAAAAVSLLPWWARRPLRLPLLPVTEAVVVRPASKALMELIRWSLAPSGPRFDVSEVLPPPEAPVPAPG